MGYGLRERDAHKNRCGEAGADLDVDLADPFGLLAPSNAAGFRVGIVAAAEHLGLSGEIRVRVVDDARMADSHQRYSGVPGTTDVLTFDLRTDADRERHPARMDVDLLVCHDQAARQAAARGHTPENELLLYVVHGLLHCLGHDDHEAEGYARMHAEEDRVLAAIGIGPVFGVAGGGGVGGGGGEEAD